MCIHRIKTEKEFVRHHLITHTFGQQLQHFCFAFTQRVADFLWLKEFQYFQRDTRIHYRPAIIHFLDGL